MRSAAIPASIRRAGPGPTRISRAPCATSRRSCSAPARRRPDKRSGALRLPCWRSPRRTARSETFDGSVDGTLVWPPRGDARLRLRSDVPARRPRPHLRRDERRGEARLAARRDRPRCRTGPAPSGSSRGDCLGVRMTQTRPPESATAFGVYVHWPFCAAKCPYCDFNTHVRHAAARPGALRRRLRARARALRRRGRRAAPSPRIFLGGGTPSLMEPATVARDPRRDRRRTGRSPPTPRSRWRPIPSSVEAERFRGYRAAGVNRVSLGVQALDDADAARARPPAQRRRGARGDRAGARDLSAPLLRPDLCAPRPDARTTGQRELREALALAADHLSLYQLTIEDGHAVLRACTRPASSSCPTTTRRPTSTR